jgi:hypothetical protein
MRKVMQTGFYCVVQFQPDRFRREGVNIGVIVVAERDREIRLRFAETNERARLMFPGAQIDDRRLAAATRALARRLLEVDRTEEAFRDFIKRESSQLVIFPPMPASIDDLDAAVDRVFKDFVADLQAAPRVVCPRCSLSFDPAASTARPETMPSQVLRGLPLPPRKPRAASLPRSLFAEERQRWGSRARLGAPPATLPMPPAPPGPGAPPSPVQAAAESSDALAALQATIAAQSAVAVSSASLDNVARLDAVLSAALDRESQPRVPRGLSMPGVYPTNLGVWPFNAYASVQRAALTFRTVPSDSPEPSNVLRNKEHWS